MQQQGKYSDADLATDVPVAQSDSAEQPLMQRIGHGALDFAKGLGEGATSTIQHVGELRNKIPRPVRMLTGDWAGNTSQEHLDKLNELATPTNTMQNVGKGVEQAAEFLIPGGAEEAAAEHLATAIPKIGETGAKIVASAAGSGAMNKLQGGSFLGGAAAGAVGAGVGAAAKKVAPVIAEKAMGVRATDRAFKRTPGRAILDETRGVKPGTIAEDAKKKVGEYTADLDQNARGAQTPFDLDDARNNAQSWLDTATLRNNKSTMLDVGKIGQQLDSRAGQTIPRIVPAHEALALRRGIDDLQTSWNPATTPDFTSRAVDSTRGVMNDQLEKIIPMYKDLTGKLSTLMPVADRATAADLNESLAARVLTRAGARTGAGFLGAAGAAGGYHSGGIPGAIAGGLTGMIAPELFTHPTTLMLGARTLDSPALEKIVIPASQGAGLNLRRSISEQ